MGVRGVSLGMGLLLALPSCSDGSEAAPGATSSAGGDSGAPFDDDGSRGDEEGLPEDAAGEGADEDSTLPQEDEGGEDGGGGTAPMCDPRIPDDCGDGQKCTFYRDEANPSGSNKCVPLRGAGIVGDPCEKNVDDTDGCGAGHLCWGTEPDNTTGICVEFCGPNDECSTGDPCTITNDGALPMCLPVCDPFSDTCANGWACYDDWYSDDWFCDRDKSGPDLGRHGDPCTNINGCDPGLICMFSELVDSPTCADSGSSACCTPVCDLLDADSSCPGPGETCRPYYGITGGEAPPGYESVGICALVDE